jgi:flavin reductase (DIM6/NTAB) family NADH-FMN oxidoreductase RutF
MLENFDAEHAVAAARTIERSSSRDDLPLVPAALAQLEADVKSVQDALGE